MVKKCCYCKKLMAPNDLLPRMRKEKQSFQPYCRGCNTKKSRLRYSKKRFSCAQKNAAQSGHPWSLSEEEYKKLTSDPCRYCRLEISDIGIGLDRLDNSKGYEPGNVAPCCKLCNLVRGDRFTPEEMIYVLGPAIQRIRETRRLSGSSSDVGRLWKRSKAAPEA